MTDDSEREKEILAQNQVEKETPNPAALLIWSFFVLLAAAYLCMPIYSATSFGQLAFGNWIWSDGQVPATDLWSVAGWGKSFALPGWLFHVLMFKVEAFGGGKALILLKLALYAAILFSTAHFFSCKAGDRFVGTIFALLVCAGMLSPADIDTEVAGFLLLVPAVALAYCSSSILVVFALGLAAVNFTSSSLLVWAVFSLLVFQERSKREAFSSSAVLAVSLFCSPYLGRDLAYSVQQLFYFLAIQVGRAADPATVYDFGFAFLFLLWLILGLAWHGAPRALKRGELTILLAGSLLALTHKAFLPYALFFTGLSLSLLWGRAGALGGGNLRLAFEKTRQALSKVDRVGVVWLLLCLLIPTVYRLYKSPVTQAMLPAHETDFMLEKKLPFPLLHEAAVGPYLMYRFTAANGEAEEKIFAAPWTAPLDPASALGDLFLSKLSPGWERNFSRADAQTVLCRCGTPLYYLLSSSRDWRLVFEAGEAKGAPERVSARFLFSWAVFVRSGQH